MIPKECKCLAKVDFPIAVVSKHSAREKSIRHGHPSTLHLWWARRPLASSRAVLMALLLPDHCDPQCPPAFKDQAREILLAMRGRPARWDDQIKTDEGLRRVLLTFIGDFANWDNAANRDYLATARGLVKAAHPEETPLVVDPFAGGGSIPLMRSFWLCKKANRKRALRPIIHRRDTEGAEKEKKRETLCDLRVSAVSLMWNSRYSSRILSSADRILW